MIVLAPNFTLTEAQHTLLTKGLFFIPTLDLVKDQKINLRIDMQEYHRKIKLAAHFRDKIGKKDKLPFTGSSTWTPSLELLPQEVGQLVREDTRSFKKYYVLHVGWM